MCVLDNSHTHTHTHVCMQTSTHNTCIKDLCLGEECVCACVYVCVCVCVCVWRECDRGSKMGVENCVCVDAVNG